MSNTLRAKNTAILIFAQPPRLELRRKRWHDGSPSNTRLYDTWNRRIGKEAAQTGFPVLRSAELIDHSGSFEHQLKNALALAFDKGFDKILCVGNDCPGLDARRLTEALHVLDSGGLPIGADHNGGVYLFGLSRENCQPFLDHTLPWQTGALYDSLRHWLRAAGPVVELGSMADVHSEQDLRRAFFSGALRIVDLIFALSCLANGIVRRRIHLKLSLLDSVTLNAYPYRGPPARL